MAIRPQVLRLVLHTRLVHDTRRLAQSTRAHRLNIFRDRTMEIESSLSMLTTIVTKSMGGKVRTRSPHGPKLHDRIQVILPPCPSMIRMATVVPFTRCLIPKSKAQCIRRLLCIGLTPLRHNILKHLTHRITITLRQIKTTCKPLPKQLQRTQTLYVHLPHDAAINTPSERRC